MFDAFLSYGRADDKVFVSWLYDRLTAARFRIWFDEQKMPSRGETFLREIQRAIDESERVIAVVGPGALASDYVRAEWDYAQLFSKVVVPILRSGSSPDDIPSELRGEGYALVPEELRRFHCPDFRAARNQDEAFRELERILEQPVSMPGEAHHVPPLPVHFLARRELLREIAETLLVDAFHPVTVKEAAKQTTLLHGLPGAGKSVLASALARDVSIRRSFRDGVIWLTVTQTPDLLRQWRRIGKALKDARSHYADLDSAEDRLQQVLKDRECLIVMDDVWEKRHVEPVYNALGGRCRLLLTAREKGIGRSFGAAHCEAAVLSPHEALSLLSQRSEIPVEHLPREAEGVARACGYLPLALAMSGAMVKAGIRWRTLLDALAKADLSFLGHELANYPHPHVMRALQVSVDFMKASNPDAPARYHDLAVFLGARQVPEAVVLRLWCHEGLDRPSAEKLLIDFDSASLLRVTGDRRVELHDLQWDYVRKHAGPPAALHQRLVAAYGDKAGWPGMRDDHYFFARIAGHAAKAGLRDDLLSLVSPPWMQAQFNRTLNHGAFAADLDVVIGQLDAERPPDLPALARACLVRATLGELSTRVPPAALAALAICGEPERAEGFAALIVEPENRAEAFEGIAAAVHHAGDVPAARRHLTSALLAALQIEDRDEPDAAVQRVLHNWMRWFGDGDLDRVPMLAADPDDKDRLFQLIDGLRGVDSEADAAEEEEPEVEAVQPGPLHQARALTATFVEAGDFEAAIRVVAQLPSYYRPKFFEELAPSLVRHGQWTLAIDALKHVEYEYEREKLLVPLTTALLEAQAYAEAVSALETVGKYYRSKAATPMAMTLVDAGEPELALKVAQLADSAGLETDIVVRMFKNAVASGRINHPQEISKQPIPDHMKPDVLKALALAWAERGAHDLAVTSALMIPEQDRSEAFKELALATAGAGDLHRARDLVPQMAHDWHRSQVLKAVAEAHLTAGHLEDAFEAARSMPPDHGIDESRSEALFSVLALALALGRLEDAVDIADSFDSSSGKARALAELARAHAPKDQDRARELLDDILSLSLVVPANQDRDNAMSRLGALLAGAGRIELARALADALADVQRARVYGAIAVAEVPANPDRASDIVDSFGALQTYGVRWIEAQTLLALASACVAHQDPERARAFAARAVDKAIAAYALQDAGMRVLFDAISAPLATAYGILRKTQTPRAAESIFRGRSRLLKYKRDAILQALAAEEATSGIAAEALKLALEVKEPPKRVEALVAVAKSFLDREDTAGALSAARAALDASSKAKVGWQRTEATGLAAGALIRAGDTKTWKRTLESALKGADGSVAAPVASTVARALAETGHTALAREWLDRVPRDRPADVTGETAIALLALGDTRAGRTAAESLLKTADSIPIEYDVKTTALLHAASAFATLREPALAFKCLVECDLERDDVKDALSRTIEVWRATADPAVDPGALAKSWVSRCRSHGNEWERCANLATVSAALARVGRADVGALTFVRAIIDARIEGRGAIFAVLERGAPLLAALPDGRGLAEIVQHIVEVEGWWQVS